MLYWLTYNLRPIVFGALSMACFVAIWPLLPFENSNHIVTLKNDTPLERRQCEVSSAVLGQRILDDKSKGCSLLVYGHYDFSGNFIVMLEMRNPFDWALYRAVPRKRSTIPSAKMSYRPTSVEQ